ncbi:YciI family protein [Acrocarpospora macrocephala]|nr:YciI family protein [Acrocarpospora macrocephala]
MKYMLLLWGDEKPWAEAGPEERERLYAEHGRFNELLASRDAARGGEELALSSSATTVRKRDGETLLTDGPFAETVEQLGGFYLVEAKDLDEALEFAKACPSDVVEVRPVVEYQG